MTEKLFTVKLSIKSNREKTYLEKNLIECYRYGMFVFSVEKEMKLRSHAVQRNLPRPLDVNENILRNAGPDDPPLSELQKVRIWFIYVVIQSKLFLPIYL